MNRSRTITFAVVCLLGLALPASATVVVYDFGDELSTGGTNNVTQFTTDIVNSVDANGSPTGIALNVYDPFFPNDNPNGTQAATGDAAIFDLQTTRDNLFGNGKYWEGHTVATAGVRLTGLDPSLTYDFVFFASRMGVGDIRDALYEVTGLNAGSDVLNASNNESEVAFVGGISPTAGGMITIDVSPGPNNSSSVEFYYLGVMQVSYVPEPATLALLAFGGLVVLRKR